MMRRGQAALEYLVTYGWAFIAILIVLGSLAYFGLLTPTKYLPSRCSFGVQLECADYILESPDTIRLMFRNNFGDDIRITSIQTETGVGTIPGDYVITKGNSTNPADPIVVTLDNTYPIVAGDRQTVVLVVAFERDVPGSPSHNITGEIFATAQ